MKTVWFTKFSFGLFLSSFVYQRPHPTRPTTTFMYQTALYNCNGHVTSMVYVFDELIDMSLPGLTPSPGPNVLLLLSFMVGTNHLF